MLLELLRSRRGRSIGIVGINDLALAKGVVLGVVGHVRGPLGSRSRVQGARRNSWYRPYM
jgi:hypothetical protein